MSTSELVSFERIDRVAVVAMSRPDEGNAIDDQLFQDLAAALRHAESDDQVWSVLLRGNGTDFCQGVDWSTEHATLVQHPRRADRPFMGEYYAYTERMREWWTWLWHFNKPIVAEVHGDAVGWGADLVLVSHTSVAAESARIGDPSVRMGLVTQNPLWSWRVGPRRAREVLMLGRMLPALEAQKMGLITRVVPDGELTEDALTAAQSVAYQGGIVGWDGNWLRRRGFGQATDAARGVTDAWISAGGYSALAAIQRRGFQGNEFDFEGRRMEIGTTRALDEMKQYYRDMDVLGVGS